MKELTESQKADGFKIKKILYTGYIMNGGTNLMHQYQYYPNGAFIILAKKLSHETPGTLIELPMNVAGKFYPNQAVFVGSVDVDWCARLQLNSATVYDFSIAEKQRKSNKAPDYLKPIIKNLAFAYKHASNKPQFLARLIYLITK